MIKRVIFTVALLFASGGPAHSQNGASFPVQQDPGSDPITCDIGPSYTGSIPAAAAQAGFTHCAANYDFSQTQQWTDSVGTHQWSNLSTWLSCTKSRSAPALFTNVGSAACDSNHVTVTTDSGVQVVVFNVLQSDAQAGLTQIYAVVGNGQNGDVNDPWRPEYYVEFTVKISNLSPCSGGAFCGLWDASVFSYAPNNQCFVGTDMEFDEGGTGATGIGMAPWNLQPCGQSNGTGACCASPTPATITTGIQTWGGLMTGDNVNTFAACNYQQNGNVYGLPASTWLSCFTDNPDACTVSDSTECPGPPYTNLPFQTPMVTYIAPGANGSSRESSYVGPLTVELYRYTIWECAGYVSGPCINNPVITTAP
jgi:hypothetical protein